MKKVSKILLLVLTFVVSFFSLATVKANVPDVIYMTENYNLPTYIGTGHAGLKKLADGTVVYCMDLPKRNPQGVALYRVGEADAGIAYIIENGWPRKSITGDDNKDAYLMQIAIWWYLDDVYGMNNLTSNFKNNYADPHNLKSHIFALIDGAKNAKNNGYPTPSMSLQTNSTLLHKVNKDYYESDLITLTSNNLNGDYTVALEGSNANIQILDVNGNARNTFNPNEGFIVRVLNAAFDENMKVSVKINASAQGVIYKAYRFESTDSQYQPVVVSNLYPEYTDLNSTITLNGSTSKVSISKQDITDKKELPGAHLVIKDKDGNVIEEWTSTNEPHYIKFLTPGTYTLTETIAPEGYVLSEEVITFEVKDNGEVTNVVMYNAKEVVEVPITDSNISPLIYVIGFTLIGGSSLKLYKHARN